MNHVAAVVAVTLDGKITPARAKQPYFGSEADKEFLYKLRGDFDAVLCGGETFREWPHPRLPETQIKEAYWNIILSQSSTINLPKDYSQNLQWLILKDKKTASSVINDRDGRGINRLLVEGGSKIFKMFLNENLIDKFYITICPRIIGDDRAVSLVSGDGFDDQLERNFKLVSCKPVGDEIFLCYEKRKI